jgi:hypothetical protein
VGLGLFRVVSSSTSRFAISFPMMLVCTLNFCNVILCGDQMIWLTIVAMSSLSSLARWLCWGEGRGLM